MARLALVLLMAVAAELLVVESIEAASPPAPLCSGHRATLDLFGTKRTTTVLVSLTDDQAALCQIQVRNYPWGNPLNGIPYQYLGGSRYYADAVPLTNGSLEVRLGLRTVGMAPPASLVTELLVDSPGQVSGTVGIAFYNGEPVNLLPFVASKLPRRAGDANCDEAVDSEDALTILQYHAGQPSDMACG